MQNNDYFYTSVNEEGALDIIISIIKIIII